MNNSRVIQGSVCPGGWHYKQVWNGVTHTVESDTYLNLLAAVQLFRHQNGITIGNVEADVENYICDNFPRQCRIGGKGAPITQIYGSAQNRFLDRITQWIARIRGNNEAQSLVTGQQANQRSQACVDCPENQDWESSCGSCVQNARTLLGLMRQGKGTDSPYYIKLKGCQKQGWCNRTAVWLPRKVLIDQGVPDNCWMKKEPL